MRKPVKTSPSGTEYLEADLDDIRLGNRLAHEILGHSLDELSRPGQDLLLLLDEMVEAIAKRIGKESKPAQGEAQAPSRTAVGFSRREVREFTGWTNTRLHIHLKELADFEYVIVDAGRNGMPFRYRLAYEGQGKDGRRFMLGLKDADTLKPVKGDTACAPEPCAKELSPTFRAAFTGLSDAFQAGGIDGKRLETKDFSGRRSRIGGAEEYGENRQS